MVNPTLLVLAAGTGSRSGGPKGTEPVGHNGELIVDYSIYDARRSGFGKVVFVIRKEAERRFKEMASARVGRGVGVEYVFQELSTLIASDQVPVGRSKPWGTTHAILMAANVIHEPFAVINLNDFYGAESYRALAQHLTSGTTDYAMVGFVLRDTLSEFGSVTRGVCQVNESGYLDRIVELEHVEREGAHARNIDAGEETKLTGNEVVSMNMWGFTPQVFAYLREDLQKFLHSNGNDLKAECHIPGTVNNLLMAGQVRVKVLRSGHSWFGITYGEDHTRAVESIRRMVEDGHYPKRLWG